MKRTPLADTHEALNARMVDFSGWYLPVQYEGIFAEHNAVREKCGIFDTCHMGRVIVKGDAADEYLSSTLTVDASSMPDGRCRYGFMLTEDAGIIDDLIVYRISKNEFMVVINSATLDADIKQLNKCLLPGVTIENVSSEMAKLDIQGPDSPAVASSALGVDISDLGYFRLRQIQFEGQPAIVSKTGYTGETGYEVYLPASLATDLWESAMAAGATPAGLGARDTLRLEAGLPLYGHEMSEDTTPVEAGFMRYIDSARAFVGSEALRAKADAEPAHRLTPFVIEGRQSARNGNKVLIDDQEAGWVTSGSFAPSLGYCIGFAYIKPDLLGDRTDFSIDSGRKIISASLSQAPFYKKLRKGV